MKSLLSLPSRYAGLFYTAKQIGHHFPKSKYYIEPFSGLARTAKYSKSKIIILNDISDYANKKCKKLFPNAIITGQDFPDCIERWNFENSFFLIDPVWRISYYNKTTSITNRNTAVEYLKDLEKILPMIKGTYIITLGKAFKIKAPYSKLIVHTSNTLFGHKPNTRLFSNKPLTIRCPQITNYF